MQNYYLWLKENLEQSHSVYTKIEIMEKMVRHLEITLKNIAEGEEPHEVVAANAIGLEV